MTEDTLTAGDDAAWRDPLLVAAKIMLFILLAGLALAMIVQFIAVPVSLMHPGDAEIPPIWGRVLGLVATGTIIGIVLRLLQMIASVEQGDPFAIENARRLDRIAGDLVALQVIGLVAGGIGYPIGGNVNGFDLTVSSGIGGVCMALLVFILARVFRRGAQLRDDVAGTV